ncbi:MAG: hypothetical protein IJU66_09990 [Oscillospiraceae bacterium]|nr:hypothetical protein [Oscillospiraceae bacterium]
MSREKEVFHDNVAALNEMFPDKGMLTKSDVARFMGASLDTVSRRIRFNAATKRISKADLARQITV